MYIVKVSFLQNPSSEVVRYFDEFLDIAQYLATLIDFDDEDFKRELKDKGFKVNILGAVTYFITEFEDCDNISFCINRTKDTLFIGIEEIKTNKGYKKLKAWGGDTGREIFEVFPKRIITEKFETWFKNITSDSETYYNIDGKRIALKEDDDSMEQFKNLRTCCGSYEEDVEIDGKLYVFGFNYGH